MENREPSTVGSTDVSVRNSYRLAQWIFLRLLGIVFLIAFGSLWTQLSGLIGSRGISPAAEFLPWIREQLGPKSYIEVPTLCWISSSDAFLHALCGAGIAFSLLLIAGVAPRWTLLLLWALYLSLVSVGDVFLQYQWDNLLLETSFFSIFFAPAGLWPAKTEGTPSSLPLWLLRWLLFRLMFLSGVVKLASGDATWRDLTALQFHYWTQPLPTSVSYYAHHLPPAVHTACAVVMFAIEVGVPFLIFGPRRARLFAAAAIAFFQLLIAATGNYGFFNLLTLALCVLLLDDAVFSKVLPQSVRASAIEISAPVPIRRGLRAAFAVASVFFVLVSIAEMRFWRRDLPRDVEQLLSVLQPFRSINSYGLFAVMTTTRPEILVEGSQGGQTWQAYQFKWKPGDLERHSGFVAPHQPRLDWQMWFAALGSCSRNPWFVRFQERLLEGSPAVLSLLEGNPFASSPPRYIRSTTYRYRFSEWAERKRRGVFWEREQVGPYCPILSLRDGRLIAVSAKSLEEQ